MPPGPPVGWPDGGGRGRPRPRPTPSQRSAMARAGRSWKVLFTNWTSTSCGTPRCFHLDHALRLGRRRDTRPDDVRGAPPRASPVTGVCEARATSTAASRRRRARVARGRQLRDGQGPGGRGSSAGIGRRLLPRWRRRRRGGRLPGRVRCRVTSASVGSASRHGHQQANANRRDRQDCNDEEPVRAIAIVRANRTETLWSSCPQVSLASSENAYEPVPSVTVVKATESPAIVSSSDRSSVGPPWR